MSCGAFIIAPKIFELELTYPCAGKGVHELQGRKAFTLLFLICWHCAVECQRVELGAWNIVMIGVTVGTVAAVVVKAGATVPAPASKHL